MTPNDVDAGVIEPERDTLDWAIQQVTLYHPKLKIDINKAYELPFVEAAAILHNDDDPEFYKDGKVPARRASKKKRNTAPPSCG